MKIYTKKGDKGKTTLVGGNAIEKDSILVEAYGTIDELIANIGTIHGLSVKEYHKDLCLKIQETLMLCAANVANIREEKTLPDITEEDVKYLEENIDLMDLDLKPLTNFILFTGTLPSYINIYRTLTRRAERRLITLNDKNLSNNKNIPMIIKYLNRLSDLFFTMARHVCLTCDESCEKIWKIKKIGN